MVAEGQIRPTCSHPSPEAHGIHRVALPGTVFGNGITVKDRVAELESRLAAVEQRLRLLERASPNLPPAAAIDFPPVLGEGVLAKAATHTGKVLLIFGGAYLLRTITDFGFVPTGFGIFLGAAYALVWLFMAWTSSGHEKRRAEALFYGTASMLLALPLLVEAITRFGILSGRHGVIALTMYCAAALAVAVARDLRVLGWLITAGAIVTAFVVLNAAHTALPVGVFLVLLGLASLTAVYWRRWMGLQWLGALGALVGLTVLTLVSTSDQWSVRPLAVYLLAVGSLAAYLIGFAVHSHLRGRSVGVFETMQALAAVGIVFWVAGVASQAGELVVSHIGIVSLAFGVAAYALAFTPETRSVRGRNFFFYSTLGLGLVVAGSALLLSPGKAAAVWSLMALAMAWFSGRYGRVALSLQCTFLLLTAGVASGVLDIGLQALAGATRGSWPSLLPSHLIVAGATVACLFIPVAQHSERWGVLAGLPQLLVLALSVWGVGGLMVVYLAPVLAGAGGPEVSLGALAALRTAVLSGSSVTLALSSRHKRWPEARWLAYPVLVVVGIKLIVEDFPNGQPVTLFMALALVGSALILVARLLSRERADS